MATAKRDLTDPSVQGPPPSRLLTVKDVAELLSVSTKTVYRLRAEGRITFLRIGGSLRFRLADVEAFENRKIVTAGGYAQDTLARPVRLKFEFDVKKTGRGLRRH